MSIIVLIDSLFTCLAANGLLNLAEQIYQNHCDQITHTTQTNLRNKHVQTTIKQYYMNKLIRWNIYYTYASELIDRHKKYIFVPANSLVHNMFNCLKWSPSTNYIRVCKKMIFWIWRNKYIKTMMNKQLIQYKQTYITNMSKHPYKQYFLNKIIWWNMYHEYED